MRPILDMMKDNNHVQYRQELEAPKSIRILAKTLQSISPSLAATFAARLFRTPIKHKAPKREEKMLRSSRKEDIIIPGIDRTIRVYHYGNTPKKVLLVHGWSGRGTQLCKIAEALIQQGYSTVSFDAPAHGHSPGNITDMTQFIQCATHLDSLYGPFEFAAGHSLGGMTLLNAVKNGMQLKALAIIGSGDLVSDIAEDFVLKIGLKPEIRDIMKARFDKRSGFDIETLSASHAALFVKIPVLVVHDTHDMDVPLSSAKHIASKLADHELLITEHLGHRKILGNETVIRHVISFFSKYDKA